MKSRLWIAHFLFYAVVRSLPKPALGNTFVRDALHEKLTSQTIRKIPPDSPILIRRTNRAVKIPKTQSSSSYKPGVQGAASVSLQSSAKPKSSASDAEVTSRPGSRVRLNKPPKTEAQKETYNANRRVARLNRTEDQKRLDAEKERSKVDQRNKGKTDEQIKSERKAYAASAAAKRTPEENKAIKRKYRETEFAKETPDQRDARRAVNAKNHQARLARMTPEERRKWQDAKNAKARQARANQNQKPLGEGQKATRPRKKPTPAQRSKKKESSPEVEISEISKSRTTVTEPGVGMGALDVNRLKSTAEGPSAFQSASGRNREDSPVLVYNPNPAQPGLVNEVLPGSGHRRTLVRHAD